MSTSDSQIVPRPFDQAWTLEDTRWAAEVDKGAPASADKEAFSAWIAGDYSARHEKVIAAVKGHVLHMALAGTLPFPPNAEHVEATAVLAWRDLVENPQSQKAAGYVGELFGEALAKKLPFLRHASSVEEFHEKFVRAITAGNFGFYDTELGDCANSGLRLRLVVKDWVPELGTTEIINKSSVFTPLAPGQIRPPGIEHVVINAPSGELLINDWLRIGAFTELTQETLKAAGGQSICSSAGRVLQTQIYARELGFASVSSAEGGPEVFLEDGRLLFGYEGEDSCRPASRQSLGSVCTDLWWSTIIDRQVLVDLVARKLGPELAEKEVVALEAETADSLIKVSVPPGQYHLYFSADTSVFGEKFASEEVSMEDMGEPMFVLSPSPLTLIDKPAKVKRPRP